MATNPFRGLAEVMAAHLNRKRGSVTSIKPDPSEGRPKPPEKLCGDEASGPQIQPK
jgi:hypothetical protein